jgi:hypothetical protein
MSITTCARSRCAGERNYEWTLIDTNFVGGNDEARMSNAEIMTKPETKSTQSAPVRPPLVISHSFVIRHLDFVILTLVFVRA